MNTKLTNSIPKRMMVSAMAIIMLFGVFVSAPRAQAQTDNEAVLEQIEALMEMVRALQAQLATLQAGGGGGITSIEGGFTNRNISVQDRVQATDVLRVRSSADTSADLIANVSAYTQGTVLDGPRYANGYTWWYVAYSNGVRGWSAANWLRIINAPTMTQDVEDDVKDKEDDDDMQEEMDRLQGVIDNLDDSSADESYENEIVEDSFRCDSRNLCTQAGLVNDLFIIDADEVDIDFEDDDSGVGNGAANFIFEFAVTAVEDDLYIKVGSFTALGSVGEKADYMKDAEYKVSSVSSADEDRLEDGKYYYRIREGDTETFTVYLYYDPVVESRYIGTLYGFDFRVGGSDLYTVDLYPERPTSGFVTIEGFSYEEWLNEGGDSNDEIQDMVNKLMEQIEAANQSSGS